MASKKINITVDEELLGRIDKYAKANAMTRSGLLAMAAVQYLSAVELMPSVNKLLSSVAAVVDGTFSGELAPEDAEQRMQQIQNSYAALTGSKAGQSVLKFAEIPDVIDACVEKK